MKNHVQIFILYLLIHTSSEVFANKQHSPPALPARQGEIHVWDEIKGKAIRVVGEQTINVRAGSDVTCWFGIRADSKSGTRNRSALVVLVERIIDTGEVSTSTFVSTYRNGGLMNARWFASNVSPNEWQVSRNEYTAYHRLQMQNHLGLEEHFHAHCGGKIWTAAQKRRHLFLYRNTGVDRHLRAYLLGYSGTTVQFGSWIDFNFAAASEVSKVRIQVTDLWKKKENEYSPVTITLNLKFH